MLAAARAALLVTTDRVVYEARRRIELGLKRSDLMAGLDALESKKKQLRHSCSDRHPRACPAGPWMAGTRPGHDGPFHLLRVGTAVGD
jgi:hypothetical protein